MNNYFKVRFITVLILLVFSFMTLYPFMQSADSYFGWRCWDAKMKCIAAWASAKVICEIANRTQDPLWRKACIAAIKNAIKVCKQADIICMR